MPPLEHSDELVVDQEYKIVSGRNRDSVGVCRAIRTTDFGYVWGEIELSDETQRVRWNLLAIHPEPPKPEIGTLIGVWMCPTCGAQGPFAGFCDADHVEDSARLVYRSCVTVDQIERARDEYIEEIPEASATIDAFLKKVFATPLIGSE